MADVSDALSTIEPLLDQVNVSINGTSRTMYGFATRLTFPEGTCIENIFVDPNFPPPPGECTPANFGATLFLWESHAANQVPDRMLLVSVDEGTTDFSLETTDPFSVFSAVAAYVETPDNFYFSNAGTVTTHITSTGQGCSVPLPPFAKSATCNIATFDEQGSIAFELLTGADVGSGAPDVTIAIPHQTLHGLWEQITETQPVSITSSAAIRGLLRQPARAPLLFSLGKFRTPTQR
ncbi:MAG TPA: hypothetical protein VHL12_05035 [Gemmatimonadaceae bacterium]|nr:hypothetical protein [Gemmatimonadaceae bacterium]